MEYATPIGIVVAVLIVGLLLKQIKIFIILALLAGGGAWFFLLNDTQKEEITKAVQENDHVQQLQKEVNKKLDTVKSEVTRKVEKVTDEAKDKAMEQYKKQTD